MALTAAHAYGGTTALVLRGEESAPLSVDDLPQSFQGTSGGLAAAWTPATTIHPMYDALEFVTKAAAKAESIAAGFHRGRQANAAAFGSHIGEPLSLVFVHRITPQMSQVVGGNRLTGATRRSSCRSRGPGSGQMARDGRYCTIIAAWPAGHTRGRPIPAVRLPACAGVCGGQVHR